MPMVYSRYPKNWKEISLRVREEADWKCEWCGAEQGEQRISARGKLYKVVLTVAHTELDGGSKHDKSNLKGLRALCQACHLRYDHADHVARAKKTRAEKKREEIASRVVEPLALEYGEAVSVEI